MNRTVFGRWLAPRARGGGRAALFGFPVGMLGVLLLASLVGDVRFASEQVFTLAALVFGFGLLGWSGSAMMGGAIETMNQHLDSSSNWTEADSRRAMARIIGFGVGGMMGAIVGTLVLG